MGDDAIRRSLASHWELATTDPDGAHEVYHDDAVLEFPQSGERFVGKERFLTWRRQYPADLDFRIRRISGGGPLWVAENLISYDGGPWAFAVSIMDLRDGRIARERVYVTEGFEPAPERARYAERFDPLESQTPADWVATHG